MLREYREVLKELINEYGRKALAEVFNSEDDFIDTADAVLEVYCEDDMVYFDVMMKSFVKDCLIDAEVIEG